MVLDLFSDFRGFASAWALPFSEKHQISFYRVHHPIIHQKGSAPALANPAKSKIKSKYHWRNIIKKWIREKTNPCKVSAIRVSFFDLWPCRRLGTQQRHHGINISVRIMCPSAYGDGQKFKHGLHGGHGFDFFTDFFLKPVFFGFIFGFQWIRECLWHSLFLKSCRLPFCNTWHNPLAELI